MQLAQDARRVLKRARQSLDQGEYQAVRVGVTDAHAALADIERLMIEAKVGK